MKTNSGKYLLLFVVLLLNAFANLQANVTVSNGQNFYASLLSTDSYTDEDTDEDTEASYYIPLESDRDYKTLFDLVDCEEIDNEESTSRNTTYSKDYYKSAFSILDISFPNNKLNKSTHNPLWAIIKPGPRLHLKFQVFII